MTRMLIGAAALLLSGCGQEAPQKPAEPSAPATLPAGAYDIVSEVTKLVSTDKSTPATKLKLGEKQTIHACVAADSTPDMAMFMEAGDDCTATNSFARSGRLSYQFQCSRKGKGGLYPNVDGNYTATGFEALVTVASAFPGDGDYSLTRHLTATRTGNCPPAGAATDGKGAS